MMCLNRRYAAIAMEMVEAGYSDEEANSIYTKVKDYEELRHAIMQRSGDYVDMKRYDAQMRALLDRYIIAPRSEKLESLDNFSFLDIIQIDENGDVTGVDENAERERNPEEYKKFSERINRLLTELQAGTIEYRKFLQEIKLLSDELRQGNTSDARLDNAVKKDLCDNLGGNIELALRVYETAKQYALPHFRENPMIYKQLKRKIAADLLGSPYDTDVITLIIKSHTEEF